VLFHQKAINALDYAHAATGQFIAIEPSTMIPRIFCEGRGSKGGEAEEDGRETHGLFCGGGVVGRVVGCTDELIFRESQNLKGRGSFIIKQLSDLGTLTPVSPNKMASRRNGGQSLGAS
jgi:hypothetical protein